MKSREVQLQSTKLDGLSGALRELVLFCNDDATMFTFRAHNRLFRRCFRNYDYVVLSNLLRTFAVGNDRIS